jgi:hypothetical protein
LVSDDGLQVADQLFPALVPSVQHNSDSDHLARIRGWLREGGCEKVIEVLAAGGSASEKSELTLSTLGRLSDFSIAAPGMSRFREKPLCAFRTQISDTDPQRQYLIAASIRGTGETRCYF